MNPKNCISAPRLRADGKTHIAGLLDGLLIPILIVLACFCIGGAIVIAHELSR